MLHTAQLSVVTQPPTFLRARRSRCLLPTNILALASTLWAHKSPQLMWMNPNEFICDQFQQPVNRFIAGCEFLPLLLAPLLLMRLETVRQPVALYTLSYSVIYCSVSSFTPFLYRYSSPTPVHVIFVHLLFCYLCSSPPPPTSSLVSVLTVLAHPPLYHIIVSHALFWQSFGLVLNIFPLI